MVDIDHVPSVLFGIRTGFVPFAFVPAIGEGRNLHGLALVIGGLGCACAGGYLVFLVLSGTAPWATGTQIWQGLWSNREKMPKHSLDYPLHIRSGSEVK